MADTTALKNRIRAAIKANDNQEITGPVLQQALLDMVDELNDGTEAEASIRSNADATLQGNINAETSARESADQILQNNIDYEEAARESADQTLQNKIDAEQQARESADQILQNNIDYEEAARESADQTLYDSINAEAAARESADQTLQNNIDYEEAARESADQTLQNNIDAEKTRAEGVESTLQQAITAEKDRAEAAFDDLDMIDAAGSQVSPEAIDLTLRKNDGSDEDPEWRTLCQLLIPSATTERAGLMSVAMRNLLYNLRNAGYAFSGIAVTTTNPGVPSGNCFYVVRGAGTYTHFKNADNESVVLENDGIYVLTYDSIENNYWEYDLIVSIDSEPTAGSDNLVKSGGVADAEKYNNYKCSALETIIFGAKNIKAYNVNGWLGQEANVINMTSSESKTLILSVVPGDIIECTQSNGISIAFIKDFTLARTYPVVRSSEYPQSLQDPSYVVAPDDAKYCFISYKYYDQPQRGIEYVKYNGTFLSYEAINIKGLKDDVVVLQNGNFDKLINFGEFRTAFNTRYTSPFALLCTEDGNITSFQLKLLESSTVTISVCRSVDDKEVLSSRTLTLPAGINTVELDEPMPVLNGNMVMCENAVSCYDQDTQSEDIFYSVGSSRFVKRGDYVRFTFGFTVKHSLNAFQLKGAIEEEAQRAIQAEANLKNELENVEDGNFSLKETIGDSTTALTFNAVQSCGLLCSRDGLIDNAIIHTGEASTVTIAVYESKDSANLMSTKQVQLEAGVNKLSNLNISVNKGNIVYISGTKLTYRVYSSEDSIFYSKVNDEYFAIRGDHVRFEFAFTIGQNVDLYDTVEAVANGSFSKTCTIGDKSTASTFNIVQSTALLCKSSGIINKATIHTGEASTAIIEVYKAVDDVTLLSTKEVQLQAGVNHLDNLNIRVLGGNMIHISGTKLTYRVPQNLDSIFYTKGTYGFGLRGDHVRFEVSYEIDSSANTFDLYTDVEVLKEEVADLTPVGTQYITITPGTDNYNLIRNTIASITDATANKPYVVIVPEGEYVECDLQGKKYVTIRGENRNRVIIKNDGTSTTRVTPSDYFWPDYANMPLNEIPRAEKHIVAPKDDIIIENCTLIANDCKYVVHGENSGWSKATFKNCELIATNCNYTVGLGLRHIQHIEFIDCHLTSGNGVSGIMYYHNWTWQQTTGRMPLYSGGCKASFKNCKLTFSTDAWLILDELASRNDDITFFENCKLDYSSSVNPYVQFRVNVISGGVSNAIDLNGNHYTVLEDVPYCMRLIAIKSGFSGMSITNTNRPLADDYVQIVD